MKKTMRKYYYRYVKCICYGVGPRRVKMILRVRNGKCKF